MIRMQHVRAIARAELRLTRRLARYWIFLGLSYLIGILAYLNYARMHGLYSSLSASAGVLAPGNLVSALGMYYLLVYVIGVVFLAFDLRARDMRERMTEVLDSRPYTNLELVVGRFFGLLLPSWLPILGLALLWETLGLLLISLGAPIGDTMNLISLFGFVFLMALPALAFALSLVFLVTLVIRNRLAAAVLVLALIGTSGWAALRLPINYGFLFDIIGFSCMNFPSEIVPDLLTLECWVQRFGFLFAAFGLLGFSAVVHPRLDGGSPLKLAFGGTGFVIIALICIGFSYYTSANTVKTVERWKTAHAACRDIPEPDLQSISGEVKVNPGRALDLELDLTFRAPDQEVLDTALFTLNPGQQVTAAVDTAGQALAFTHENGLLQLTLPQSLAPGGETTIHLSIKGLPDHRFAFLESAIDLGMIKLFSDANLVLLGLVPAFYDSRFVALMPSLRWLPVSGPETNRDDSRVRTVDFFRVDLTVDLPSGWLAAGPGRRHKVEGNGDGERFRFSPGAPVPEVAMIASRFESRSVEIEGVFMELLIHPKHTENFELMADTTEKVHSWIGERLREARDKGLGYPYNGLSMVEVPSTLRTYGGGWRMDTVMAQPGLLLMREIDFPMARFDTAFRNPDEFKDREGGIVQAKWERLRLFFASDFSGGNIFTGGARNFFMYQTAARGPEALALNYVIETLSSLLIMETTSYFSVHPYVEQGRINQVINTIIGAYVNNRSTGTSVGDAAIEAMASRPWVWDKMLEVSLEDIDPWEDPARTVDILTLKASAVARSILNTLGIENTGRLLASLRDTHRGKSFTVADLLTAGKALGYDLDALFGDWLGSTALPGFVCTETKAYRLPDSADGSPRYQLLFTVRNDEPAPGLFRFIQVYSSEENVGERIVGERIASEPNRLAGKSAIRYGMVVSRPPTSILFDPYLSLNRAKFMIELPSIDAEKIEKADAVVGIEEIPWALPEESSIVVDDLDAGFQALDSGENKGMRISARKNDNDETDQGLPTRPFADRIPSTWSRISRPIYWGKYRHTMVAVKAGDGEKKAVFTSAIPHAGWWNLEVYIPVKNRVYPNRKWGTWHMIIKDGNGDEREITFDSYNATEGWNLSESFNLPEGEVAVTLSNKTDGQFVIADAIRWSPSAGN